MEIDVFKFDCHSRMITGDLRKNLKAEEHPPMKIRFLPLERYPAFQQKIPGRFTNSRVQGFKGSKSLVSPENQ